MPRHLSILLLGLLLLVAAACSKQKDAEPTLEGRWKCIRKTQSYVDRNGIPVVHQDTALLSKQYLEITSTAWIVHDPTRPPSVLTCSYTRQGDTLTVGTSVLSDYPLLGKVVIIDLTASSLHVQSKSFPSVFDHYYTR